MRVKASAGAGRPDAGVRGAARQDTAGGERGGTRARFEELYTKKGSIAKRKAQAKLLAGAYPPPPLWA